jgi:uncharacterized protein YacL
MNKITFLIDENVLGIDRYLDTIDIHFIKIGNPNAPPKGSDDPTVAKYAHDNNLVVVTNDENLVKQCKFVNVPFVTVGISDLVQKVIDYTGNSKIYDLSKGVKLNQG